MAVNRNDDLGARSQSTIRNPNSGVNFKSDKDDDTEALHVAMVKQRCVETDVPLVGTEIAYVMMLP